MINGRISSRSYPRYRLVRPFFRRVLADVDRFCMQSEESARRLVDLGADPARVTVTGSLKFDSLELPAATAHGKPRERVLRFFRLSPNRTVIVAGSTMRGEEAGGAARLRARSRRRCRARCWCSRRAIPSGSPKSSGSRATPASSPSRRSELPIDAEPRADVVVLDTIGELAQLYQVATAVFVGGSLVDHGGHNILEPAIFGKPIVFGPHMQNFKEIADAFLTNGAAMQVQSERELDDALLALVTDPVRRARLGAAARALVEANRGAKTKTLAVIAELLPPATAAAAGAGASVPSAWCIDPRSSELGCTARRRPGAARWYARDPSRRRRLARPVVSVGNLRVGGSGKTPIVDVHRAAAARAAASGPAILTRGYGRRVARDGVTVVSDGARVARRSRRRPATSR